MVTFAQTFLPAGKIFCDIHVQLDETFLIYSQKQYSFANTMSSCCSSRIQKACVLLSFFIFSLCRPVDIDFALWKLCESHILIQMIFAQHIVATVLMRISYRMILYSAL